MNHLSSSPPLAKDLMDSKALPLRRGKFENDLALQFLSGQYCGWPVVDSARKILGIVSDFRLFEAVSRLHSLDDLRVEDTMTMPVYVHEDESLDKVLDVMTEKHVQRMPVVRNHNLVGVISRARVLQHCLSLSSAFSRSASLCPWCERVQDPSAAQVATKEGRNLATFLSVDHLKFSEIDLVNTYCPTCVQTLRELNSTSRSLSSDKMGTQEIRPRLLVVDDDPSVAGLLTQTLQEWGYEVLVARNGWEGLAVASRQTVDGILLDLDMPIMDGRTMLDELRWLGHQMPVLMMSGASDERALRQLLQEGAQGFFVKPFHLKSLKEACRRILQKSEAPSSFRYHVV
ncbi:MAG: response regulator [Nitrospirales bacterium]|nr:response regulator [Nitrospira sp.]MDR4462484.1 response regulator [Nitrospirales bacterium]